MTNNRCPYQLSQDLELVGKLSFRKKRSGGYMHAVSAISPRTKPSVLEKGGLGPLNHLSHGSPEKSMKKGVSTYWTQIFSDIDLRMILSLYS